MDIKTHGGFNETILLLYILVHFSMNSVKVREVRITTKLKSPKLGNGGCIYDLATYSSGIWEPGVVDLLEYFSNYQILVAPLHTCRCI